jgi:arabinogalactan endo-1,4-beta-galactosidase
MTEMEADGYTWQDNDGNSSELMPLLNDYDLDAVRLRVWVDPDNSPANGWCDIQDMVTKAVLADAEGLDVMICIHYSDHWADPGQQNKPQAWSSFNVSQLETAVTNHTTDILNALSAVNISPKWVQIGNETNDGMLWPTGRASAGGFANYASFVNAGSTAVKTFNPNVKTILHLSNGFDQGLYNWNINGLINNGLNFNDIDIIGMSLYPEESNWKSLVDQSYSNMQNIQNNFNKNSMIVEVGFSNSRPDITYQFIVYMIEKTRQAQGLGVFYWEPIAFSPFTSYSKGAWDTDGSPSVAFDAFLDSSTLSSNEFEGFQENQISLYPNPVNDRFFIDLGNINYSNVEVFDIQGKLIFDKENYISKTPLDISQFSNGVYFVKIEKQLFKIIKK